MFAMYDSPLEDRLVASRQTSKAHVERTIGGETETCRERQGTVALKRSICHGNKLQQLIGKPSNAEPNCERHKQINALQRSLRRNPR